MTKSTSTLVGSPPDPLYNPLPPSVEDILIYNEEINDESPYITFEWATHEIKNHLLNWVRVGLVADKVRYLKLWKGKFSSFADYCQKAVGKTSWQISRIIKAARVTITLAHVGFDVLPNCEAQASKLAKFLSDPLLLVEKWQQVLDAVPKHLITANAIGEVFGEQPTKQKLSISPKLKQKLQAKANELGISVEELLEDLLGENSGSSEDDDEQCSIIEKSEDSKSQLDYQKRIENWQTDLEQICREQELKTWLSLTWLKLLVPK